MNLFLKREAQLSQADAQDLQRIHRHSTNRIWNLKLEPAGPFVSRCSGASTRTTKTHTKTHTASAGAWAEAASHTCFKAPNKTVIVNFLWSGLFGVCVGVCLCVCVRARAQRNSIAEAQKKLTKVSSRPAEASLTLGGSASSPSGSGIDSGGGL